MKNHTASLVTAAMLLTVAWMTGCDSGQNQSSSSAGKTVETTLLTTVSSKVEASSETAAAVETELGSQTDGRSNLEFDSYDAFTEAMGEYYPGVVLAAPPQIVSGEWKVTGIYLLTSSEKPFYNYDVITSEGQSLVLTVSHEFQFDSIDAVKAQMQAGSVQLQEDYSGSNWVIGMTNEPSMYVLYGLTGDENLYYTLIGADAEGNSLEPEELQALHDDMRL